MPKPYSELVITIERTNGMRQFAVRKPVCPTCGDKGECLGVFLRHNDAQIAAESLGDVVEDYGAGDW